MALNYDFAKKPKEDSTTNGAPPAAEEPKVEDRPKNTTGEDRDTFWIDEAMVIKSGVEDLENVKNMFAKIHEYLDDIEKEADALKVVDETSMQDAIAKGTQAKQWANKIEKRRKEVKAPYLAFTKRLDALTKGVTGRLEAVQESLRVKIRPIMREIKAKEEAAREAALKAQREAAKPTQGETPPPPAVAPPAPAGSTKTESGSARLEKTFEWDVNDITKVPQEYLSVVPSKVNSFIKANLKLNKEIEIPGLTITYTEDVAMRAAKS
jgi:hypothetical protein